MNLAALLLSLETQVWQAFVQGDAESDRRLLAPDFLGVYAAGLADREAHAAQLLAGPSIASFEVSRVRGQEIAPWLGLITYLCEWTAPGEARAQTVRAPSVWRREPDGAWLNVFSQDTELPG